MLLVRTQTTAQTVHPHECGEHSRIAGYCPAVIGSSPRVRGTSLFIVVVIHNARFIPTSAGNIVAHAPRGNWYRFIPTSAGNMPSCPRSSSACTGSSPRVRGTCSDYVEMDSDQRFIPTSAGNISPSAITRAGEPVHPHECGEHGKACTGGDARGGSSPRVRGTCQRWTPSHFHKRFIPTSAGNMGDKQATRLLMGVHPHECGEHYCLPRDE